MSNEIITSTNTKNIDYNKNVSSYNKLHNDLELVISNQKAVNSFLKVNNANFMAKMQADKVITKRQEVIITFKNPDGTRTVQRTMKEETTYEH